MKRAKLSACLPVLLLFCACKSEDGAVLEIRSSPDFADDCSVPTTPEAIQGTGIYDPSGGISYFLTLEILNNANTNENPAAIPGDPNVKPEANNAQIIGFDFCFYSADEEDVTAYDPKGSGLLVDCDDLPDAQRAFLPGGGSITAGAGRLTGAFAVLDGEVLKVLFGTTFEPTQIPSGDNGANLATRDPAWGNFPATRSALVTINLRVRAKSQSGSTMRSNWYSFPVLVAPRIFSDTCTVAVLPCPGGGSALQGSQLAPGSCPALYSGAPFSCEPVDLCP